MLSILQKKKRKEKEMINYILFLESSLLGIGLETVYLADEFWLLDLLQLTVFSGGNVPKLIYV